MVAQYEGQLTTLRFQDGDTVPKGAIVATVSQPAMENDLHLAEDENAAALERLADLQSLQKLSLDTLAPLQQMQAADAKGQHRAARSAPGSAHTACGWE